MLATLVFALLAAPISASIVEGQASSSARSGERGRGTATDTIRRASAGSPLGLPRATFDSSAGVLGSVDSIAAPTLGNGGGIAVAGRVTGARLGSR